MSLLHNLFRRDRVEHDLDRELHGYLELLTDEKIAAGLSAAEAARQARLELGGIEQVKEEVRAVRPGTLIVQAGQDLRYGGRMLRRNPGFTVVAVATLAIGVGATTAIFSVLNAILLRPLPYPGADRLFVISGMSYAGEFVELQRRARTFDVTALASRQATLTGDGEPLRIPAATVSPNFTDLLGAAPALGRGFGAGDDRAAAGDVVLISDHLWRTRLGADPRVLGRRLVVDGVRRTIIGVMPADAGLPTPATEVWIAASVNPADRIALWSTSRRLIGRVRDGYSLEEAHAEVRALAPAMSALFPWRMPADYGTTAAAVPLHDSLVEGVRAMLLMLLAAVAVVFLIACVNVSNLLVARSLARQRELAIRASLGAARGRLLRQVMTEGVLLVTLGLAASLPLAYAGTRTLAAALPGTLPRTLSATPDVRVLGFGALLLGAAALIVGVIPAARASRVDLVPRLAESDRSGQGRRTRWTSNLLVGSQVALAVVLVITATLLVQTLVNIARVPTGFSAAGVLAARVSPPSFRFPDPAAREQFYESLLQRATTIPGVSNAALADRVPFAGEAFGSVFIIAGRPNPATTGEWPMADVAAIVSPQFFPVLSVSPRHGRSFTANDSQFSQRVVVISESLARRYWPGQSAVGSQLAFPGDPVGMRTVIGIVPDLKWERTTDEAKGVLYTPLAQATPAAIRVVIKTSTNSSATFEHLKSVVRDLDRDTPVDQIRWLDEMVAGSADTPRFAAALLGGFALTGLLLGAIGIYGTISDQVAQRRREIGVRMALGASRRAVVVSVAGGTLLVVFWGGLAGLAGAAVMTRTLSSMLFGVHPTDAAAFGVATGILALTAVAAACLPARRATRVDPLTALR